MDKNIWSKDHRQILSSLLCQKKNLSRWRWKITISTCIIEAFCLVTQQLVFSLLLLYPVSKLEKRFRYRFLQVPMKCSLELWSTKWLDLNWVTKFLSSEWVSERKKEAIKLTGFLSKLKKRESGRISIYQSYISYPH